MKKLLALLGVAVLTANSLGCSCCGGSARRVLAAAPPATYCDPCQQTNACDAPSYGDPYTAPPMIAPGPIN